MASSQDILDGLRRLEESLVLDGRVAELESKLNES